MKTRHKLIIDILKNRGDVPLSYISDTLGVSLVTLRKDANILEEQGLVIRKHGVISMAGNYTHIQQPYKLREMMDEAEKKKIANKAAELINKDDSIILDSGTTTYEIAKQIFHFPHISIATNSVCATNILNDSEHSVFLAGGTVLSRGMCTIGEEATHLFQRLHANKAFISTTGIRDNLNLTVTLDIETSVKKAMIEAADQIILVATANKFNNSSLFDFCAASKIDIIITTKPSPPESILKIIRENNIQIIYADD